MTRLTRILLVEDSSADAALVQRELHRTGLSFTLNRVQTEAAFVEALRDFNPDIILSDHSLPTFSAKDVVRIAVKVRPDTPIVIVTGSLDEETAVEYLKAGASDYVLKHKLLRLGPAVERALDLKLAQREQRQAEDHLRAVFDAAPVAMFAMDREFRVQSWNPAAEVMFGWPGSEVIGQMLPGVPDDRQAEYTKLMESVLDGTPVEGTELRQRKKDGGTLVLRLSAAPLHDAAQHVTGIVAMGQDVTDIKRLEEQYRQSQKMESVGRLAGGVAHDFNNLLTVILGECELALMDYEGNHPIAEVLNEIRKAGDQAAGLTRQLLAFSRQQVIEPTVFPLNDMVLHIQKMLGRLIGEDIELTANLAADAGAVRADRGQMEQVLLNLAVNARDAMPEGGALKIETQNMNLDEFYARTLPDLTSGDYVVLSVSDTGAGIPTEIIDRIFEPFFTTKEQGRGTGLGLATCYGIVKQAGGHITAYSELGIGTTMKVYLPLVRDELVTVAPRLSGAAPRGGETILLVEDQAVVRELAARMLQAQGYSVLTAGEGDEALRVLRGSQEKIDLLLSDVVLPGMKGEALARAAIEVQPDLRVLFASGYTGDMVAHHRLVSGTFPLLQKPFSAKALAEKVREVLDRE